MVEIPKVSQALWQQLQVSTIEMPYFEAYLAHDVLGLFRLGLIAFEAAEKPLPTIRVVLTQKGKDLALEMKK